MLADDLADFCAAKLPCARYRGDSRSIRATKETGILIRPGDVLVLELGGGGGWGDPGERSTDAIAADHENGFVSALPSEEDS